MPSRPEPTHCSTVLLQPLSMQLHGPPLLSCPLALPSHLRFSSSVISGYPVAILSPPPHDQTRRFFQHWWPTGSASVPPHSKPDTLRTSICPYHSAGAQFTLSIVVGLLLNVTSKRGWLTTRSSHHGPKGRDGLLICKYSMSVAEKEAKLNKYLWTEKKFKQNYYVRIAIIHFLWIIW